jgi:hypothetical protein
MAHMGTLNNPTGKSTPTRSYIAMRPYNNDFFTYTTSTANFITSGTLSPVSGATAVNCKQGALLVETGRKVYPGANPGIQTYMVAVFDNSTGLNGFIDPNSTAFTPQNTDRPYYIATGGSNSVDTQSDLAPPVYTHGDIFGSSNLDISGSAMIYDGITVNNGGTINNGLTVNGGETVNNGLNVNTGDFTVTAGKVYLPSVIVGSSGFSASNTKVVTGVTCTSSSKIFLQLVAGGSAVLHIQSVGTNTFTVNSTATSSDTFNFLIIN